MIQVYSWQNKTYKKIKFEKNIMLNEIQMKISIFPVPLQNCLYN